MSDRGTFALKIKGEKIHFEGKALFPFSMAEVVAMADLPLRQTETSDLNSIWSPWSGPEEMKPPRPVA
jgi:hypothetical protein